MGFAEKLTNFVTGKSTEERAKEKAAYAEIKTAQREAYLAAKKDQAIRLARSKAQIETDASISKIRRQYNPSPVRRPAYSNPFSGGGLTFSGTPYANRPMNPTPKLGPRRGRIKRRKVSRHFGQSNPRPFNPIWGN